MHDTVSVPLSARAAAARCGLSERTLRRWIAAGLLHVDKQGGTFLVSLEDVRTLAATRRGHAAAGAAAPDMSVASNTEPSDLADNSAADSAAAPDTPNVTAFVDLIAQLHAEVSTAKDEARQHAEAAAMWQERAGTLAERLAAAESRLLALAAPQQPVGVSTAPPSPEPTTGAPGARTRIWDRWWWPILAALLVLLSAWTLALVPR
jgi:hypothetical protein